MEIKNATRTKPTSGSGSRVIASVDRAKPPEAQRHDKQPYNNKARDRGRN